MKIYKGIPINGKDFYSLLLESNDFLTQLGKMVLAAGQLEAEIILYFSRKSVKIKNPKATLGQLIKLGKDMNQFDTNLVIALNQVNDQRNEFIHNIYSLFIELIDEKMLPRTKLLDSDVVTYVEYAWLLKENLDNVAKIIKNRN